MSRRRLSSLGLRAAQRGLSLIELMVALILGLLVSGAAISMFMANSRTYNATESLSRVQENARIAFELMARDLREVAATPCSRNIPIANVLNNPASNWWSNWGRGVQGYNDGGLGVSLAGTDALEIMMGSTNGVSVTSATNATEMLLTPTAHGLVANDIVMVCNYAQGAIFQVPAIGGSGGINLAVASTGAPGNCTQRLSFPAQCGVAGVSNPYGDNAMVVRLQAARWYVAANGRGGNSLFRLSLRNNGAATPEEVVEGVDDLQVTYLLPGANAYVASTGIAAARWREVLAVRVELTLTGQENVGTDGSRITRGLRQTVNIRNRSA